MALVFAECLTRVVIPLNDSRVPKSGVRHANRKTAGAREQFYATHREIS
jgi:hypothetical protein